MFEIKYDRDGNPIRERAKMEEYAKSEEPQPQAAPFPPEEVQAAAPEEETVTPPDPTVTEEQTEQPITNEVGPTRPESAPHEESDAKKSFREVVQAKKRAERERDEYLRRIEELEARSAKGQPKTAPAEEEDDELRLGADDIAEGKHLSKVENKIRKLEKQLAQEKHRTAEERAEALLRSKYTDFDKVVSRDNIEMLTEAYPELARSLHATDDLYTKAVSAYTLIKKFGIYQDSPFQSEKAVAIKNAAKPRPLTSVSPQQGESALSRANAFASGLTDELKVQLRKEMEQSRMR